MYNSEVVYPQCNLKRRNVGPRLKLPHFRLAFRDFVKFPSLHLSSSQFSVCGWFKFCNSFAIFKYVFFRNPDKHAISAFLPSSFPSMLSILPFHFPRNSSAPLQTPLRLKFLSYNRIFRIPFQFPKPQSATASIAPAENPTHQALRLYFTSFVPVPFISFVCFLPPINLILFLGFALFLHNFLGTSFFLNPKWCFA